MFWEHYIWNVASDYYSQILFRWKYKTFLIELLEKKEEYKKQNIDKKNEELNKEDNELNEYLENLLVETGPEEQKKHDRETIKEIKEKIEKQRAYLLKEYNQWLLEKEKIEKELEEYKHVIF